MMTDFKPFADDTSSAGIGGLTVENGRDRVAVYGSLDIGRDASGLESARRLRALLDGCIAALEAGPLPAAAERAEAPVEVANPFG